MTVGFLNLSSAAGRQHQRGQFCRCISFHGSLGWWLLACWLACHRGTVGPQGSGQVSDPATMALYSDILRAKARTETMRLTGPILSRGPV
jgi:hypothetical protein